MKYLQDIFTEADGTSFDISASLAALAVIIAIGLQVYVTIHTNAFDILNFSTGIGALIVSVGASQKLKPQSTSDK